LEAGVPFGLPRLLMVTPLSFQLVFSMLLQPRLKPDHCQWL